jgi:2-oxoglutarate dehydrogenase E2 component (dihydrolipoamide succinyltransferase)
MPTPVLMPQMGESIAEGTIVRWMKKVGDTVDLDEPLFEISTDKVDAEIPSPAAGVLAAIAVKEGETVPVDSVVATIRQEGEPADAPDDASLSSPGATPAAGPSSPTSAQAQPLRPSAVDVSRRQAAGSPAPVSQGELTLDELRRQRSSPLVRRIARAYDVDITGVAGSGVSGRVTKHDIMDFIESGRIAAAAPPVRPVVRPPAYLPGERVDIQPLSIVRRKIAEHMVLSRKTSAHVHTVFHVDFSRAEAIRKEKKAQYEQDGVKLTYMAFIARATVDALRRFKILNASLDGDNVVYKHDINLGIAVALETGLIVPVIKQADEKNMLGLSRAILDVADRARTKQLRPEEVHGGTFTITNPGQLGAQFGLPIINQPQVAILGVGTIEKRPVVVDDALAIRTMGYLTLGFDHRLIDGVVADQFMADLKHQIEHFDPAWV